MKAFKFTTNNISVRSLGRLQITTRHRSGQRLWGVRRVGEGSLRIDTGRRVTYLKLKPRKFHHRTMVTNVPRG